MTLQPKLIALTALVVAPVYMTASTGIQGCPTILSTPPGYAIFTGTFEMLVGVPYCNGWLGYIPAIVGAAVLYSSKKIGIVIAIACAMLDAILRMLGNDEQWAILMPLWKLIPSVLFGLMLATLISKLKKWESQQQ